MWAAIARWLSSLTETPQEREGPTGMLVGSILALMAFLLAISMGIATDRFDARRGLALTEANAIGTTYLRAGYLPEPTRGESRTLLREYVPLRIVPTGTMSVELVSLAVYHASYTEALNEMIDVSEARRTAGIYARIPQTVLFLLFFGTALSLGMVGYSAGLTGRRSPMTAVTLIVVLGAVITLVIDIERPQGGSLTVRQVSLEQLQEQSGPPSP